MVPAVPAPRRHATRLYLVLAVAVVAVAVAVAVVAVFILPDSSPAGPRSATEAVRMYLDALARGDADAALALSKQSPPDKTLLTDDVLRRQLDKAPITDIQILTPDDGGPMVNVRAKFGDQLSDAQLLVTPPADGQPWKVDHAAIELNAAGSETAPALASSITVLGRPVPKGGTVYVFPGWIGLSTTNPYVDVAPTLAQPTLLNGLAWIAQMNLLPGFEVNDAGKAAATTAILAALTKCAESKQLVTAGCPQGLPPEDFVDGTVSWTDVQNDGINVGYPLNAQQGTIQFLGRVNFRGLTVQEKTGGTFSMPQLVVGVSGTADMTQTPPAITMDTRR